jgi:hypothetical protein
MRGESERERERMLDEILCGPRKIAIGVTDRKG